MAATAYDESSAGSPAGLLAALVEQDQAETAATIEKFRLAADWADLHPVDALDAAATLEGTEGELAIAGPGAPLVAEFCVAEFALAVGKTTDAGQCYLGDAVEVRHRLPRLWARVMAGRVPVWKARRLAQHTRTLPFEAAAYVDRHLAPVAGSCSFAQLERTVEDARARFDPVEAEHRRLLAAEHRHLDVHTDQVSTDGTVPVTGELDLADALDLDHALTNGAAELKDLGCAESLDVRRAMAAGALARGQLTLNLTPARVDAGGQTPKRRTRELVIYTHLSEDALVGGLAGVENTRSHVMSGQVADWCAAAGTKVTVRPVLDLTVHLETDRYQPTPALRDQVIGTHASCVFPGCTRPSRSCDLDHVIPWDSGGPTCSCNLVPLCRWHHRLKTHGHWKLVRTGHRLFTWTSPLGQTYTRHTG